MASESGELYPSESTWLLSRTPKGSPGDPFGSELLEPNEPPSPRKLRSSLGFWDVYAMTVTVLLNAIFINHSILQVGSLVSALALFATAGLVTCCCVAVYIELSTFLPSAGGDYEYIRVAFGNMPGFTYAWMMYIFLQACTTCMQALTFSTHISCKLFPDLRHHENEPCMPQEGQSIYSVKIKATAIAGILALVWLNCFSIKVVSRIQKAFAVMKGAMVAFVFLISVRYAIQNDAVIKANVKPNWSQNSVQQVYSIVTSLLWSVNGFNSVVCLSEEVVNPRKNMRGGLFYGMLTILVAYGALVVSYFCVLDKDKLSERTGVAAQVVSITMGRKYESVFTVFVALSTLACLNGGIATGSRWLFATARNRQMPSFMAKLGKRTSSPYAAALMQSSWYFYAMIACAYLKFQWTLHSQIWTRKRILTSGCALVVFVASLVMMSISFYEKPLVTLLSLCFMLSSIPAYHFGEWIKYRTSWI
ncbi:amino acid transporter [Chloropicon primus]|nr:amino acid transporter [Chloropicon primus]